MLDKLFSVAGEGIVKTIGGVIDDLTTSDEERLTASLKARELDLREEELRLKGRAQEDELAKKQIEVNIASAKHPSILVAGARPFVIWGSFGALLYQAVMATLGTLLTTNLGWGEIPLMPEPLLWMFMTVLSGLCGLRTIEKGRGHARENLTHEGLHLNKKGDG